ETNQLMVSLLKYLNSRNQLFNGVGIIAWTTSAQFQIRIDNSNTSHSAIKPKFDFGGYTFDMPMCFKRHRIGKLRVRLYRLSKHEDISTDAQHPSATLDRRIHPVAAALRIK
ncbi:MAG TPA: hypothetical protein VHZ64_11560, partial [Xanthobacteraceae bacterium]|nr:hypothetical protein [Xanthobacteraceae bacterium]